jgi:hypothetical protein
MGYLIVGNEIDFSNGRRLCWAGTEAGCDQNGVTQTGKAQAFGVPQGWMAIEC